MKHGKSGSESIQAEYSENLTYLMKWRRN